MNDQTAMPTPTPTATLTKRDELRAKILQTHQPKSKIVEFFGAEIELRQPLLDDVIKARENPDRQSAVIDTLLGNAYVPGTNEKVFEDGDVADLRKKPFGADMIRVSRALEELSEVNFLDQKPDTKPSGSSG